MLRPITSAEWKPPAAAHLLNRAGFGGSPREIQELYQRGPQKAVDFLVDFESIPESFDPPSWLVSGEDLRPDRRSLQLLSAEERLRKFREKRIEEHEKLFELRAWWLYRMRYSPRPLQEKLTLFWHGHFATSAEKVHSTYAMYLQNETFRKRAHGRWRDLVVAVAQDPAMLIYLDNALSRSEAPNENFARELMELFTLGEGQYTERDIKESARAFTGWTLHSEKFAFVNRRRFHDNGVKEFMGRRGDFDGTDIIDIILQQPAASEFITRKIWTFFVYEDPSPALISSLAGTVRQNQYDIKTLLREIFLSQEFYSERALRTQIKSPVQWLVGSVKALEAPMPSAQACQFALRSLGQDLFAPPNVKGWDGGASWITTATLLQRYNFAGALVQGMEGFKPDDQNTGLAAALRRRQLYGEMPMSEDTLQRPARGGSVYLESIVDAEKILPRDQRTTTEAMVNALQQRLFQEPLRVKDNSAFMDFAEHLPPPSKWTDKSIKELLYLMMSTPAFQLC